MCVSCDLARRLARTTCISTQSRLPPACPARRGVGSAPTGPGAREPSSPKGGGAPVSAKAPATQLPPFSPPWARAFREQKMQVVSAVRS